MDPVRNNQFKNNQQIPGRGPAEPPRPAGDPDIAARLRRKRRRLARRFKKQLTAAVVLILILGLFLFSPLFKIRRITIRGVYNSALAAVDQKAREQVGEHILFYGKNRLIAALKEDPFIESAQVQTRFNGELEVQVHEYSADFALLQKGTLYILDRNGRVLGTSFSRPEGVTELLDNTPVLAPGSVMYGDGPKKTVMSQFKKLMDQNTSLIEFEKLDLEDPQDITLDFKGWVVEVGDGKDLAVKLNRAINIIKEMQIQRPLEPPSYINLKFNAEPVLRPKGGT